MFQSCFRWNGGDKVGEWWSDIENKYGFNPAFAGTGEITNQMQLRKFYLNCFNPAFAGTGEISKYKYADAQISENVVSILLSLERGR